jgi:hypothetical protein
MVKDLVLRWGDSHFSARAHVITRVFIWEKGQQSTGSKGHSDDKPEVVELGWPPEMRRGKEMDLSLISGPAVDLQTSAHLSFRPLRLILGY